MSVSRGSVRFSQQLITVDGEDMVTPRVIPPAITQREWVAFTLLALHPRDDIATRSLTLDGAL